jgi:hypothetical protein
MTNAMAAMPVAMVSAMVVETPKVAPKADALKAVAMAADPVPKVVVMAAVTAVVVVVVAVAVVVAAKAKAALSVNALMQKVSLSPWTRMFPEPPTKQIKTTRMVPATSSAQSAVHATTGATALVGAANAMTMQSAMKRVLTCATKPAMNRAPMHPQKAA